MTTTPPLTDVEPRRFRRAPVITEAVRWDGTPEHAKALVRWMESDPERGDFPEAESAYWVEHEADRDRYVMGFRSFGITDYATAGNWVVRAPGGVYAPTPDPMFRALNTEAETDEPAVHSRFSPVVVLGAAGLVAMLAGVGNALTLWYALEHLPPLQVPTFALALSVAFNSSCLAGMGGALRYFRKRFA